MQLHNLKQGSDAWHQFRLQHFGASEAAAMLGISPTTTRTELLHAKHTGIAKEFSDFVQARVLDKGHEVEARARPIVEELIGDELYPATVSSGKLSASCDGLTMSRKKAMEHKQWSKELAAMAAEGIVPDYHMAQCQQILLVTKADEVIFTVSDGTRDNFLTVTVTPDDAWFERIERGWEQFEKDLAEFVPVDIKEMPKAEVTLALPALVIHAKGEITTSNMLEYGVALTTRLAEVRAIALVTDQDFSNAKKSAQLLRENIQQAQHAKDAMLAQTATVGEAARMIDTWCEDMRVTALQLEKDVEREDKAKKAAMVLKARSEYETHIEALKADTGGPWIVLPSPDWASALKNKRNFASMQDALDAMLANAKITANDSARKIRAALACMDEEGKDFEFLLADRLAHISKPIEDIRTLVRARITEHRAKVQRDAEAAAEKAREQIRKEEADRLQREADERAAEQKRIADAAEAQRLADEAEAQRKADEAIKAAATPAPAPAPAPEVKTYDNGAPMYSTTTFKDNGEPIMLTPEGKRSVFCDIADDLTPEKPAPARVSPAIPNDNGARLTLGQINERIAPISITVAGLSELGFDPVEQVKASRFYRESDLGVICEALIQHLTTVADGVVA